MSRYAVSMRDYRGRDWSFTDNWAAGIKSGGVEGLVGSTTDVVAAPLSGLGQVVLSQRPEPMSGSLTFHCRADRKQDAGQVAADLRGAFSPLLGRENVLRVSSPLGVVETRVRLSSSIGAPVEDPSWGDMVYNLVVPVISDEGVWWLPERSGTGSVQIRNTGDIPVWMRVRWNGDGGAVTMPSGASFTLPATNRARSLFVSRYHSLVVRDDSGNVDRALWKKLRSTLPEVVPPGKTGSVRLPVGATANWREGVFDPWK